SGLVSSAKAMSQGRQSARKIGISEHRRTIGQCFVDLKYAATKETRMRRTDLPPGRHESFAQGIVYTPKPSGDLAIEFCRLGRGVTESDGLPSDSEARFRRSKQVQQILRKFGETPLRAERILFGSAPPLLLLHDVDHGTHGRLQIMVRSQSRTLVVDRFVEQF